METTTQVPPGGATRDADDGYLPAAVVDVDVSQQLPAIAATGADGRRRDRAWILVRVFGEPIGTCVLPVPECGLEPADVAAAAASRFGAAIGQRVTQAGGRLTGPLPVSGVTASGEPPFLAERQQALADAPSISVIICTRDRAESLRRCLEHVLAQRYPDFHVVVVDNAPTTAQTRQCVERIGDSRIRYTVEPQPGLSAARNHAIGMAGGDVLAWMDDDEIPDPHWLAEIARALHRHPAADAVSGAILPAELATRAQELFERFGGHSKGRGFTPAVFSPASASQQHPMYPRPFFGAGGNMAFRRPTLLALGGFDTALGAGTPAMGAEDTEMFTRLLLAGGTVVYQPSALVWHHHHRDLAGLRRQLRGYGVGLTAYYTSLVYHDTRRLVPLARLLPTALRDLFGGGQGTGPGYPRGLMSANHRGMLRGPDCYLRGLARARRLRSTEAP